MWALLELILVLAIVLVFITEFFLPIIMGKPLFGSFKKKEEIYVANPEEISSFDEKMSMAKEKVKEVKNIQNEVNERFKTAEQLKEESDNLLK